MNRPFHLPFVVFLLLLPSFHATGQGLSTVGGEAGAPFRMGFGARGMAMGNALVAVVTGTPETYYNPAIAPFLPCPDAALSAGILTLDRRLNTLRYQMPVKPAAGLSLSVFNSRVGSIDGRDVNGVHTEDLSTSENMIALSFALKPSPKFAFGLSMKIFYYSLYEKVSSTTLSFDIGALYRLSDEVSIGLALLDLNSRYRWETNSLYGLDGTSTIDRFPVRKQLGVAWASQSLGVTVAAAVEKISSTTFLKAGVESDLTDYLVLRGGIDQVAFDRSVTSKPSLGLAFNTPVAGYPAGISYTVVFEPYTGAGIHILAVGVRFP